MTIIALSNYAQNHSPEYLAHELLLLFVNCCARSICRYGHEIRNDQKEPGKRHLSLYGFPCVLSHRLGKARGPGLRHE